MWQASEFLTENVSLHWVINQVFVKKIPLCQAGSLYISVLLIFVETFSL